MSKEIEDLEDKIKKLKEEYKTTTPERQRELTEQGKKLMMKADTGTSADELGRKLDTMNDTCKFTKASRAKALREEFKDDLNETAEYLKRKSRHPILFKKRSSEEVDDKENEAANKRNDGPK